MVFLMYDWTKTNIPNSTTYYSVEKLSREQRRAYGSSPTYSINPYHHEEIEFLAVELGFDSLIKMSASQTLNYEATVNKKAR